MKRWLTPLASSLHRPRWLVLLAAVCVAAAVGGYFLWNWRETDDLRRQALAAMTDRDFERAKVLLQTYAAARPNDGEARFLLAPAYRQARVEDFDQAEQNLYEARHLGYTGDDVALEAALLEVQKTGSSVAGGDSLQHYLDAGGTTETLALEALPGAASVKFAWARPAAG